LIFASLSLWETTIASGQRRSTMETETILSALTIGRGSRMPPWRWIPVLLLLALCGLILLIFLPSILELSDPKDKGPRQIPEPTIENDVEEVEKFEK